MSGFDGTIPSPLSHSYLITGGNAAARRDYARRLAAAYVCAGERPPCGVCPHCRKAEEDIHPDVITVGPAGDKGEILVDQIRFLRRDAYILPNEARRKVYIIDPADGMNPAAQNALLKVLARTEEALSPMLSRDAPRVIPLLEAVGQARRAARFNVGSGHLLGSLVTAGLE